MTPLIDACSLATSSVRAAVVPVVHTASLTDVPADPFTAVSLSSLGHNLKQYRDSLVRLSKFVKHVDNGGDPSAGFDTPPSDDANGDDVRKRALCQN